MLSADAIVTSARRDSNGTHGIAIPAGASPKVRIAIRHGLTPPSPAPALTARQLRSLAH